MIYLRLETRQQYDSLNLKYSKKVSNYLEFDDAVLFSDITNSLKIVINNNTIEDYCWDDCECENCSYLDCLLKNKHCITFNTYLREKKLERICFQENQ